MSHETHEGKTIGEELRHHHFETAHKEISHEMHSHPKEFESTLRSINKDLAKHHENQLSVERDAKNQISHINFNHHDIYSSSNPGADKTASGAAQRRAHADIEHERHEREREQHEGRHHHSKHHVKHHEHHHRDRANDSDDSQDDGAPRDATKAGDAGPSAKPGDPKNPASKDAAGNPRDSVYRGTDGTPDADGLRGRDNAEKAMNYFQDKGLTKAQAAGIVGNFNHEAPGVNPNQHQYGGGPGFGIAQWEGSRKTREREFAHEQGKPANDLKVQLDFAWKELNTNHRRALSAVEHSSTPTQAARAFERGFEGAAVRKTNMASRERGALYAFNRPSGTNDSDLLAGR